MKINLFDVVKLQNGDKATVLNISNNKYFVEVVDKYGKTIDKRQIIKKDIREVIYIRKTESRRKSNDPRTDNNVH